MFPILIYPLVPPQQLDLTLDNEDIQSDTNQLSFLYLLDDNITYFSKYIPAYKNALLDRDFRSFVARDWRLHRLANQLHELGYPRLGHVVQLSAAEVAERTGVSKVLVARLQATLAESNLTLEMKTLGWKPGATLHR